MRGKKNSELSRGNADHRAEFTRRILKKVTVPRQTAYVFLQDPSRPKQNGDVTIRRWQLNNIQTGRVPLFRDGMVYIACSLVKPPILGIIKDSLHNTITGGAGLYYVPLAAMLHDEAARSMLIAVLLAPKNSSLSDALLGDFLIERYDLFARSMQSAVGAPRRQIDAETTTVKSSELEKGPWRYCKSPSFRIFDPQFEYKPLWGISAGRHYALEFRNADELSDGRAIAAFRAALTSARGSTVFEAQKAHGNSQKNSSGGTSHRYFMLAGQLEEMNEIGVLPAFESLLSLTHYAGDYGANAASEGPKCVAGTCFRNLYEEDESIQHDLSQMSPLY